MPALQQGSGAPSAAWMDSWWSTGDGKQQWTEHSTLFIKSRELSVCHKGATGLSFYKHSFCGGCQAGCECRGGQLCFSRHVLSSGRFLIPTLCQLLLVFLALQLLLLPFLVVSLSPLLCTNPAACSQWDMPISLVAQCLWPWSPYLGSLSCCRSCSTQQCSCHHLCSYWNTHVRLSGMWTWLLGLLKKAWIIKFLFWYLADD